MIIQKAFFYNWYMFWLNNFQGGLNLLPWHTPTEITDTNQSVITKAICSGVADYILTMSSTSIGIAPLITLANYFQPHHQRKRRSEEHTFELQSRGHLVCRLLLEKKKKKQTHTDILKKR